MAHALQPLVLQRCVFAYRSGERGHELMLQYLGVQALLDFGLRLGEGSGAALAWPLLQSACAMLREMASFESADVSEKAETQTVQVWVCVDFGRIVGRIDCHHGQVWVG